ncbi:hypothetical protein D9C83_13330 [Salinibacterium amurskyense]|nr:hypothetical protein D9C83_13330 [Salinibacterium amurskyense]
MGANILQILLWFWSSQMLVYPLWVAVSDLRMSIRFMRVSVGCFGLFQSGIAGLTSRLKLVS